jgi:hypothetical protein
VSGTVITGQAPVGTVSGSTLRRAGNLLVTVAFLPGILSHEYAHVLACRVCGVEVFARPSLNPFADSAYVDHAAVDRFGPELAIGLAPVVVNATLGALAFLLAGVLPMPGALVAGWLGTTLAVTAFPSAADTKGLVPAARRLPGRVRPFGMLLAVPVRGFTRVPGADGVAGFLLLVVLARLAGGLPV